MVKWNVIESHTRLFAATCAAHPEVKFNYKEIARFYGKGTTYDAIEGRFRVFKKEGKALGDAIANDPDATATSSSSSRRRKRPSSVLTGRVAKRGSSKKSKAIKREKRASDDDEEEEQEEEEVDRKVVHTGKESDDGDDGDIDGEGTQAEREDEEES
ncbi:hypothetical protein GP486_007811 [Trichoglossum hirsutum]|uniref:Uncharacterized protein n=1 Tax=Trichoglossum hirsutum TaxID=265104 RepID=A0A9P8L2B9_9PEZI|nr:hypothetical protein GP486_007811 [Trichoglossum hirsutum]